MTDHYSRGVLGEMVPKNEALEVMDRLIKGWEESVRITKESQDLARRLLALVEQKEQRIQELERMLSN